MPSQIKVTYSLSGPSLQPRQVTHVTGLVPTSTRQAGGITRLSGHPEPRGGYWAISVERADQEELLWVMADLVAALTPAWDQLVELGKSNKARVTITVKAEGAQPALVVEYVILQSVGALRADLDLNLDLRFDGDVG